MGQIMYKSIMNYKKSEMTRYLLKAAKPVYFFYNTLSVYNSTINFLVTKDLSQPYIFKKFFEFFNKGS